MFLSQSKYIHGLMNRTNMAGANGIATPMVSGSLPSAGSCEKND